ncbi:hypothetical protein ACEQ8H_000750 [Pleosporales sp. CAS-2024a]
MGHAVHVIDGYYLVITGIITVAYQLIGFAIAFTRGIDTLTDICGSSNFILLAILTLALSGNRHEPRNLLVSLFIMVWAARLGGFLLFRIIKTGKDDRFDDKRDKFWSFLGFWLLQMLWVWTCSLPVTILNSPKVTQFSQPGFGTGCDIAGIILFAIGFIMESLSDLQKYRFRSTREKSDINDAGLFNWTRHPNYMGDILVQFGIFTIAVAPAANHHVSGGAYAALYASVLGPFFLTTLLMFVSGLPLQERPGAKKRYENGTNWPAYERYLHRTSILIPFPPRIYEKLPVLLKRTIFLEFPLYVFDPAKHADQSQVHARSAEQGQAVRRSDEEGLGD